MRKHNSNELQPISVFSFQSLNRTNLVPVAQSAEFRLLSFSHNTELHRLELSCSRQGRYLKAILPELHWEALKPFVGKTVRLEFQDTHCGFEPVLSIQNLSAVEHAADPLETIMPLWLQPGQDHLFGELCRLISLLDAPYRELVHQILRDDEVLCAFLDRPASLGYHHNSRGGLLAHTIEVALDCEQACNRYPDVNASLTIAGALLHDIGKCQEYEHDAQDRFRRSQTGELELHKLQGVRMVSIAAHLCQSEPLMVSEICHLIMAADGPQYMGLPSIKMAEARIVQSADGRSASVNLFQTRHASVRNWNRFGGQFRLAASNGGIQP